MFVVQSSPDFNSQQGGAVAIISFVASSSPLPMTSPYFFCLLLPRIFFVVRFCAGLDIRESSLETERIVPHVNIEPAEGLNAEKVLYMAGGPHLEKSFNLFNKA